MGAEGIAVGGILIGDGGCCCCCTRSMIGIRGDDRDDVDDSDDE